MSSIFNHPSSSDIYSRFPGDKYTILKVPYVKVATPEKTTIKILSSEEVQKVKKQYIKYATAVFHRLNWSSRHDLLRMSQKFDTNTWKFIVDFDVYIRRIMERHLVVIIDDETGEERVGSSDLLDKLDKEFANGLIQRLLEHSNDDSLDELEEMILRKDIHAYYSYWRKAYSEDRLDQLSISGKEPPMCPAIVIESELAEKYGWSLEQIRALSPKDLKSLQIVSDQRSIVEFESDPENRRVGIGGEGIGGTFSSNGEVYRKVSPEEQKEILSELSSPSPAKGEKPEDNPRPSDAKEKAANPEEPHGSAAQPKEYNVQKPATPEHSMLDNFLAQRQIKRL